MPLGVGRLVPQFAACAMLFAASAQARHIRTIYDFAGGSDGAHPEAGLVAAGGLLYGITVDGGAANVGTLFALDPATRVETVLHGFTGGADGAAPSALIRHGNMLYGTAAAGGTGCAGDGCGTVFSFDLTTGAFASVHSFGGADDGAYPVGLAADAAGLFGITASGGAGNGVVFQIDPATGAETVLHSFAGLSDGAVPSALAVDGEMLFGAAYMGGGTGCYDGLGCGTLFQVAAGTGKETTLYRFTGGPDGYYPSGLMRAPGSHAQPVLYGTTLSSFQTGDGCASMHICGNVFKFDTAAGVATVLHNFTGTNGDGAIPESGVIYSDGMLFGTTSGGGANNAGVVFVLDPLTALEHTRYSFTASEANPVGHLLYHEGLMFGTTVNGGRHAAGAVFSLTP